MLNTPAPTPTPSSPSSSSSSSSSSSPSSPSSSPSPAAPPPLDPARGDLPGLRAALEAALDDTGRTWLRRALDAARAAAPGNHAATDPGRMPRWEREFAAAGRRCRAARTPASPPGTAAAADHATAAARVLLLHAARADAATLTRLYEHGTAEERCAVLAALPHLDVGDAALPLVEDALRANDTRLVAAAVGPYAAAHLPAHAWRQAVLKCLFTGVPVTAVADLERRARGDAELARMLTDYARERAAAGRDVPDDLPHVLRLTGHRDGAAPPADSPHRPTEEA